MKPQHATGPPPGRKLVGKLLFAILVLTAAVLGSAGGFLFVDSIDLPQVEELEHYRPISTTELYDDKDRLIGTFALQRRVVARYNDYPKVLRDAVISIEDKNFERHWGVNVWRVVGAAYRDIVSGGKVQGASTLTMQLSRNLFLTPERTYRRKLEEILLSIQIERRFTKAQIFTLYANQIFLGHGVYGFETGAEFYFSKHARDLTLDEAALLAGLPKAPNYYSPINNPQHAFRRRNLVINAMLEDGKITAGQANAAKETPIKLNVQSDPNSLAPYFVEEIRRYLEKKYGSDQVHEGGLRVYTTLDLDMQKSATRALLDGLAAYERRHEWKGRLENILSEGQKLSDYEHPDWQDPIETDSYVHALVMSTSGSDAYLKLGPYEAKLDSADAAWTHKSPAALLAPGDVVYVKVTSLDAEGKVHATLEQDSGTEGALLCIDNATGSIKAMVGGRDFNLSKFNRATQAFRQVGSSFKPYVYTAAIDQGATPDDMILDAPTTFNTASGPYTPHNYDERFEGNITLRHALAESRNIPALKIAQQVGIDNVINYAHRFGLSEQIPAYLPIALGAVDMTLLEQTSAFSVFPDDGVRLVPRMILKVTAYDNRVLEETYPEVKDVISQRTARVITSMLREVVLHGTAATAARLPYALAGKTGTTNDFTDAWFIGFSPRITTGVWMGFDEKRSLGDKESGARAALPIWIDYMKAVLKKDEPKEFQPAEAPTVQGRTVSAAVVTRPN